MLNIYLTNEPNEQVVGGSTEIAHSYLAPMTTRVCEPRIVSEEPFNRHIIAPIHLSGFPFWPPPVLAPAYYYEWECLVASERARNQYIQSVLYESAKPIRYSVLGSGNQIIVDESLSASNGSSHEARSIRGTDELLIANNQTDGGNEMSSSFDNRVQIIPRINESRAASKEPRSEQDQISSEPLVLRPRHRLNSHLKGLSIFL